MKKKLLLFSLFVQSLCAMTEESSMRGFANTFQIVNSAIPTPAGPYSQAIYVNNIRQILFITGQLPINPNTSLLETDPAIATTQCMNYLASYLTFCGLNFSNVVKVVIGLTNLDDWDVIAPIYESYLTPPYPTLTLFQVQAFRGGAILGIEMIAVA